MYKTTKQNYNNKNEAKLVSIFYILSVFHTKIKSLQYAH